MRVAVLGGGAVGTYLSFLLSTGGLEVTIYEEDPFRRDGLRSAGLVLKGALDGVQEARLGDYGYPVAPFDVMLFAVPAHRTAEALRKVSPFVHRNTRYLSAQDGLVLPELESMVGPARAASLICSISACLTGGGSVEVEEAREAVLAVDEDFDDGLVGPILEILSGSLKTRTVKGAEAHRELLRRTALSSVLNALCAVADEPPRVLKDDEELRDLADRAWREALGALDLREPAGDLFEEAVWDRLMPPMPLHLARGGGTEVEYLSGVVLRRGRQKGMPLPLQRCLYTVVKEMEAGRLVPGYRALRELRRRVVEDEGLGLV